ncbi:MAG: hypothetical protein E6H07_15995 [Bacteroidetes bacterium]|nr:MAG: hypothetical protein E6H07_15995 [Bacteroidota bacterium]
MNRLLLIIFGSSLSIFVNGQVNCDRQKQKDSIQLEQFCIGFKKAVNQRDLKNISEFFQFPFPCSACNIKDNSNSKEPYMVSYKRFLQGKYDEFFGAWFMETVSKGRLFELLQASENDKGKCSFFFGYPMVLPSERTEGHQGFLTIEKINGKFKITSIWSVP